MIDSSTSQADHQSIVDRFNGHAPQFVLDMGGRVTAIDLQQQSCTAEFDISDRYCHSGNIVQGGFVTAMLDFTMTHAAFAVYPELSNLASLEIKTSYLEPVLAGKLRIEGWIIKSSYKTAFMEGRLHDADAKLCATASTVAKLIR